MSHKFDYDLFVLGAGSGGVRCARWSAGLGAKVGICEEDQYGGTCVIKGCIPKKLMVYASEFSEEVEIAKAYGWNAKKAEFNWGSFKQTRDSEIQRLSGLYKGMLDKNKVDHFNARGTILDPHTVMVDGKKYTSQRILIATGGKPYFPEIPGIEFAMSSNEVFTSKTQPKSIVVVGGGYIAVEMAGIYHGLGSDVTQVIRQDLVLRGFDENCREVVQEEMSKKGIKFNTKTNIVEISKKEKMYHMKTDTGEEIIAEAILYATGRSPNTNDLGLNELGIKLKKNGAIIVNDEYQTNVESIYAIGDCTDRFNLTPIATNEGTVLSEALYGKGEKTISYENVPSAVFSQPPLATVGLMEDEAKLKHGSLEVFESKFRALKHTISGLDEKTYMKMIVAKESQKVVGIHMVGKDAAEMMQGLAIAIKAGATKQDFDSTIGIHPSSAEEFVTMRTVSKEI